MGTEHSQFRDSMSLPPGQRAMAEFPRFGVVEFARRVVKDQDIRLKISGGLEQHVVLTAAELSRLPRVTLTSDFHCAAGWSHRAVTWSGVRFRDVWETFTTPKPDTAGDYGLVVLRCQDGYRTSLPLADLLAPEVLLADRLNGQPLSVEHGAPIRLVAPAHYGYKSAKHLIGIEFRADDRSYRPLLGLLDHPRARVALEERGRVFPGWILRYAFRPFIQPMIRKIKRVTAAGKEIKG